MFYHNQYFLIVQTQEDQLLYEILIVYRKTHHEQIQLIVHCPITKIRDLQAMLQIYLVRGKLIDVL